MANAEQMASAEQMAGTEPTQRRGPGSTAVADPAATPRTYSERLAYLDRLKVVLIASIVGAHGVVGYSSLDRAWPYQPVREVALAPVTDAVVALLTLLGTLFAMGLFFLLSALVTPGSLARKGAGRFVTDRLLRLGVPFVVWVLALWPLTMFGMSRLLGDERSYWAMFFGWSPFLDTGPMWFLEVLLIYSLGYAVWWRFGGRHRRFRSPTAGTMVTLAIGVAIGTFAMRLIFPFGSAQVAHPNLWQWPQYLATFGLGIVGAQRGWLECVPDRPRRAAAVLALLGLAGVLALFGWQAAGGPDLEDFAGGRHWAAAGLAAAEGALAVGASVWLLSLAQRRLNHPLGRLGRAMARCAFAAFIAQGLVLVGLSLALRPVDLPAEVKALAVAGLGVALSFGLGWLLVTRTRLGRIL